MRDALLHLRSIAKQSGSRTEDLINSWISTYVEEAHWEISIHDPEDLKHQEYVIEQAKRKLGNFLAEQSNMYPTFERDIYGFRSRISTIYIKNEGAK